VAQVAQTLSGLGDNACLSIAKGRIVSIKSEKDFASGLLFIVTGGGFTWVSISSYTIGSASQMGPGYVPLVLGLALAMLGGLILIFSLVVETPDGGKIGAIAWRPLVCILGANLAFGALLGGVQSIGLPSMGLMVAIVALTVIAAMADAAAFEIRRVLLLASVLAGGSYGIFIALLGLPMPIWPAFLAV
jgi:hypothetical protein